uniref:Uncharacterized protein n=1 Tax=Trichuris muris TaxID=70415 RepID=A0A5S6QMC6_TRIMR
MIHFKAHKAPGLKQTEARPKRHEAGADYTPQGSSTVWAMKPHQSQANRTRLTIRSALRVHEAHGLKEMDNHPKRHQAGTDYIAQGSSTDRAANRNSTRGTGPRTFECAHLLWISVRAHCMNPSFAKCIPTYRGTNVHEAPGLKQTETHHKRHQADADYIPEVRSTD